MQIAERIARQIHVVRDQRVILDERLAPLYGVQTRALLQAFRRNPDRFPPDFLFALSEQELAALRSQSVISNRKGRGGRRYATQAFTEHGAIMAATVLNSRRAIEMSVFVVRAFVYLRAALANRGEIGRRLDHLERLVGTHDVAVRQILQTLRQLTTAAEPAKRRRIGFV